MFAELSDSMGSDNKVAQLLQRRNQLLTLIEKEHSGKKGKVVLFAPFESERDVFVQESSFYYFSGLSEPAMTLAFDVQSGAVLYQPNFGDMRDKWVYPVDVINDNTISLYGINELLFSGELNRGYKLGPYFDESSYSNVIDLIKGMIARKEYIFTLYPSHSSHYALVKQIIDRLQFFIPELANYIIDISPLVAQVRRKKSISEIELLYQAINITHGGFQAATRMLKPGCNEAELQAALEYIFTENGATKAYPSIVAGGKRSTVLHYCLNNQKIQQDDLVLIDAGAMYQHYCADITRTFPASGKFTDRQKELYEIVLETQNHVVEHIRPGVWLSNSKEQDRSLLHIAHSFLKKKGYSDYFKHNIGHYLGLDVHDVGSFEKPLQEGDVIAVEPGVYLEDEEIGIRIEDNYWVVNDATPVCLSESIPKGIKEVEEMVEESFDVDVV